MAFFASWRLSHLAKQADYSTPPFALPRDVRLGIKYDANDGGAPGEKDTRMRSWRNPDRLRRMRRLLIAAAIFHVVLTTSIYGLGRYAVLPGTFDTNGIAVSFASDGLKLSQEAAGLSELLR
ncbi:MAG TPA: hypothetical protein VGO73_09155, partial [Pyrinomonadaceae bacterium]|nr:hypothetical protein [Pyrinomonadaceae bacterium]